MSLSEQEIIGKLAQYGHLEAPFGQPSQLWPTEEQVKLTLQDAPVQAAIASYQAMHAPILEPLVAKHHPNRPSPVVIPDGEVGPATEELFSLARCNCPDYAFQVEELVGAGNWKRCWEIGEFHAALISVKSSTIPTFLQPIWEELKKRVIQAYDELGLHFTFRDNVPGANLDMSFVVPDSGWIGLALVLNGQRCTDNGWCRFDRGYKPANLLSEWTTLLKHELGHNCGLSHSTGGVMNPFIVKGLPISWKGDPSFNLLKQRFGGVPIPASQPRSRKRVAGWLYDNGDFETVFDLPEDGGGLFPQ